MKILKGGGGGEVERKSIWHGCKRIQDTSKPYITAQLEVSEGKVR